MKSLSRIAVLLFISLVPTALVFAQQVISPEKQAVITKFRRLTGSDHVNMNIAVSFDDIRNDLVASVENEMDLTATQKVELRKEALDAFGRLDGQLRAFLNDTTKITPLSEAAITDLYDQAFTVSELNELIAFYSTPTGQKAASFLPTLSAQAQKAFQARLLPMVQEFITPKIKAESDQLKQKIRDAKLKKT